MAALDLRLRRRTADGPVEGRMRIDGSDLALLLCDVWDRHWCSGATARLQAMVARMEATVRSARAAGALIVHAPSETMDFYAGSPARLRALEVPATRPAPAVPAIPEPPLPVDASDGGCDSGEPPWYRAWTRQHPGITIDPTADLVSEDGDEIRGHLRARGIRLLALLGVHTNMCILDRSFGIRAMLRHGQDCALVRDLTDAMYNPARPPHCDHDQGTALIVAHIERHLCPTIASADLRGEPSPS